MSTEDRESFSALMERLAGSAEAPSETIEDVSAGLLSPERAQRFDLLVLLIANLGKPLALCGVAGIGKSTFLGALAERPLDSWQVLSVRGDSTLRLADVLAQMARCAALNGAEPAALADYLRQLDRNRQLFVLLLDDVGQLAPGVLAGLCQFARDNAALRLVLALRPEEAHAKAATDGAALAECHFVDIPALTQPQCQAYLQRLAARPPRLLSPEDVTPARGRAVFRATEGVPGRIIELLARAPAEGKGSHRLVLAGAVFGAAVMAVAMVSVWFEKPAVQPPALLNPAESPASSADTSAASLSSADSQPSAMSPKLGDAALAQVSPEPPSALGQSAEPAPTLDPASALASPVLEPSPIPTSMDVQPLSPPAGEAQQLPPAVVVDGPATAPSEAASKEPVLATVPVSAQQASVAPPAEDGKPEKNAESPQRKKGPEPATVVKKSEAKLPVGRQFDAAGNAHTAGTGNNTPAFAAPVPAPRVAEIAAPSAPAASQVPTTPSATPSFARTDERSRAAALPVSEMPLTASPTVSPPSSPTAAAVAAGSAIQPPAGTSAASDVEPSIIGQWWQAVSGSESQAPASVAGRQPAVPVSNIPAANGDSAVKVTPPAPSMEAISPAAQQQQEATAVSVVPPPSAPHGAAGSTAARSVGTGLAGLRDPGWFLAQPPQAYTLRVMSAREASSVKSLVQRYPALQGQLVAFKTQHAGMEWYPVYFGAFASEAEALRAAAHLPAALGKPMPRQMLQVQQEIRAAPR